MFLPNCEIKDIKRMMQRIVGYAQSRHKIGCGICILRTSIGDNSFLCHFIYIFSKYKSGCVGLGHYEVSAVRILDRNHSNRIILMHSLLNIVYQFVCHFTN